MQKRSRRTVLRRVGFGVAAAAGLVAGAAALIAVAPAPRHPVPPVAFTVDVTPARVARGKWLVSVLCAACHLDAATGALTGKRLADLPPVLGEVWSKNITGHPVKGIGAWTDGEIAYLLRTGVARDGHYTPPWMIKLPNAADEHLRDIVAFLRSDDPLVTPRDVDDRDSRPSLLTRLLARTVFAPHPWPSRPVEAPTPADPVERGRYLADALFQCYGCHSAAFRSNDDLRPERSKGFYGGGNAMHDLAGRVVHTANLTPDPESGIGGWTGTQFRRALVEGIGPDNRPLRYPMAPLRGLPDDEVAAIFAYLQSLPPIRNRVPAPPSPAATGERGQVVYRTYGCDGCHGDAGQGPWDLRKGLARYPTDADLIAFIRHPERSRPGIAMPTWDGVIREDEYAPLVAWVRSLAPSAGASSEAKGATHGTH